ncbi:hypothetical protein [uncultured Draconibacterium sp.]|uniref:hypothetical protein n=1 Tax=uncultured Draconibacterium sp. TaxID=1573823 RepID=UPI003217BFE1
MKKRWFLFLNDEQENYLVTLRKENKVSFITWILFSIALPLAPYVISVFINFLLTGFCDWGRIVNNGSLPIISYGFITAGIVYILEKIRNDNVIIFQLRERIMPVAVLLLFLNSSIFILETSVKDTLNTLQHVIVLIVSIFIFYFSLRVSQNMFFLQRKISDKQFDTIYREETSRKHGLNWE